VDAAAARDFGHPEEELLAARDAAALTPLSHFGVIAVSGPDAASFLQNQLTSDLSKVSHSRAQLSGYCTAKGRLVATFVIVAHEDGYLLVLPAVLVAPIIARLKKYLLRAKAVLEDASARCFALGVCGPQARSALVPVLGTAPSQPWEATGRWPSKAVALPGSAFLLLSGETDLDRLWSGLSRSARPAGAAAWDGSQIRAGVPWILPATQELFLPQMIALEQLGAVSFEKGCYPGQEIVARTHYRGELKRHLALGRAAGAVHPGQSLTAAPAGESAATVVNAAPAPDGGWQFLAVAQRDAMERGGLSADGRDVQLTGWAFPRSVPATS
jgi:folate-binding protein YgfZ